MTADSKNNAARLRPTPAGNGRRPGQPRTVNGGVRAAARQAIDKNTARVNLPGLGVITLPSPMRLAWYGGLATIAAFGIIEWPVAAVLAAGHLLAEDHHNRLLHDFGEALEEAA